MPNGLARAGRHSGKAGRARCAPGAGPLLSGQRLRRVPRDWLPGANRHFRIACDQSGAARVDFATPLQRRNQNRRPEDHDHDASGRLAKGRRRHHFARRNRARLLGRQSGMTSFRYSAVGANGSPVQGVIEAEDRKSALHLLGERGLFPSSLEMSANGAAGGPGFLKCAAKQPARSKPLPFETAPTSERRFGQRIKRKEITAFTREMSALLGAGISIPQALDGLGEQEENPAMREGVLQIGTSVRTGASFSAALEEHPRLFSKLYSSMVRVGEEAGALQNVMSDLAALLEHEDEVRGAVMAAVSYPAFVLAFGIFTVILLLTVVLPRLFSMLEEMLSVLPLPTLILLRVSGFLHHQEHTSEL